MEPTVLDRLLGIGALLEEDTARSFAGTSLTQTRVHALWVLSHHGPMSQREISDALGTTPRSVSALVDSLESTGYARRTTDPDDGRAHLIELTPIAQGMMRRMRRDHARLSHTLLNSVAAGDRTAVLRGLDAILGRLEALVRTEAVHYADVESDSGIESDENGAAVS